MRASHASISRSTASVSPSDPSSAITIAVIHSARLWSSTLRTAAPIYGPSL